MREIKFEIMFWLHGKDFTKSVAKHYTTLDRLINGNDVLDYGDVEIIAKRQYTGQKDKNGVEIYEGDIVLYEDTANLELYYDCTDASFAYGFGGLQECRMHEISTSLIEVIGNIYENPELMEKTQ